MKLPIAILKSPLNVIFSFLAALALICGLTSVASASPGTGEKVDNFTPAFPGKFNPHEFLKINDSLGYGWCIDFGLHSPEDKPDLFKEGEVEPKRLTHVAKLPEKASETNYAPEVPFEGHRRDAAINILKKLIEAHQNEDETSSRALNRALQLLLTSTMNKVSLASSISSKVTRRQGKSCKVKLILSSSIWTNTLVTSITRLLTITVPGPACFLSGKSLELVYPRLTMMNLLLLLRQRVMT